MVEKLNLTQEQQAALLERNKELETEKYYNSLLDERVYRGTILQALSRMEQGLKELKEVIKEISSEEEPPVEPSKKSEEEFNKMWKEESSKPKQLPKAWSPEEPEPEDDYPEDEEPEEDWDDTPKRKIGRPRGS